MESHREAAHRAWRRRGEVTRRHLTSYDIEKAVDIQHTENSFYILGCVQ